MDDDDEGRDLVVRHHISPKITTSESGLMQPAEKKLLEEIAWLKQKMGHEDRTHSRIEDAISKESRVSLERDEKIDARLRAIETKLYRGEGAAWALFKFGGVVIVVLGALYAMREKLNL